jgi:hypothetical protein
VNLLPGLFRPIAFNAGERAAASSERHPFPGRLASAGGLDRETGTHDDARRLPAFQRVPGIGWNLPVVGIALNLIPKAITLRLARGLLASGTPAHNRIT